ncbi:MAG: mechanosensitive ion channel [Telmatospirillum sp.]|nr:mechanosensitive ion channel [Telmatospirillum sp.]
MRSSLVGSRGRPLTFVIFFALGVFFFDGSVHAADPVKTLSSVATGKAVPAATESPAPTAPVPVAVGPKSTADEIAGLDQDLKAAESLKRRIEAEPGMTPAVATPEEILERDHALGHFIDTLVRHKALVARLPLVQKLRDDRQSEAEHWRSFVTPPPYSILLVDQLREAKENAEVEIEVRRTRRSLIEAESVEAEKAYKAAEIRLRQAEEKLAGARSALEQDRQSWVRDLARLAARTAAEDVAEAQVNLAVWEAEAGLQAATLTLLGKKLALASSASQFPQSDLDLVVAAVDRRIAAAEGSLKDLIARAAAMRQQADKAAGALARAEAAPSPAGETSDRRAARLSLQREEADLWRQRADMLDLSVDLHRRIRELLSWERSGWRYRWLIMNTPTAENLRIADSESRRHLALLEAWIRYNEREVALSLGRVSELEVRQKGALAPGEAALVAGFLEVEQQRTQALRDVQQSAAEMLRTLQVWRQEMVERAARRSVSDRLSGWAAAAGRGAARLWSLELFSADDTLEVDGRKVVATRSVTLGKSLGVILLLLFGSLLISRMLRLVRRIAIDRLGLGAAWTAMVLRWLQAVLILMLCVFALNTANIPLTVFAFLGGALAIGVGFGTQVLLKNMISGIMLLIERPLRLGDRIEVGSVVGTVTHISVRSSTVRTSEGIEILVPNSTFIENNVTNWTYSNGKVRRSISVEVDHRESSDRVSSLLTEVASRHPDVAADPAPRILLDDFCSGKKRYQLQYWIDYGEGADGSLIASQLRFAIERAFLEAEISVLSD